MKGLRLLNGHDAEMTYAADLDEFCAALERGDSSRVQRLLSRNPKLAVAVLPDHWPVFLLQATYPIPEIIMSLVMHGADPDARNPAGETLLHLTADPEAIRKLLSVGADINALDHEGRTPMMGHAPFPETGLDAIYTLLSEGADPSIENQNGDTVASLLPGGRRYEQLRLALVRGGAREQTGPPFTE